MTDTPLIRAARALGEALYGYADPEETPNNWARAMSGARAVLEAVREPSKVMIDKGVTTAEDCMDSNWDSGPDGESYNSYTYLRSDVPSAIWAAMIAAALSE